jgi:hypothetical protein
MEIAMKHWNAIAIPAILILSLPPAAKAKKHDISPAFQTAKTVYVEAADGSYSNPGLLSADRQAIKDLEDGLRRWGRYSVADHPEGADLIFVVRKGRGSGTSEDAAQPNLPIPSRTPGGTSGGTPGGMSGGTSSGTIAPRAPGQMGDQDSISSATEIGVDADRLMVFTPDGYLKRKSPIWTREIRDGLNAPSFLLLGQLRDAVELANRPAPLTATPSQ